MKGKRVKVIIIITLFIICGLGGIYVFNNVEIESVENITPMEEISKEDDEKVKIIGYFKDKDLNTIIPKELMIDRQMIERDMFFNILEYVLGNKDLIDNVLNINEELCRLNIDKVELKNRCLEICFSNDIKEFEKLDIKDREIIINIIKSTMFEINEVDNIRVYFNGIEYIAI